MPHLEIKDWFLTTLSEVTYWYDMTPFCSNGLFSGSSLQINRIFKRMFMVRITRNHSFDRKWAMCQYLHEGSLWHESNHLFKWRFTTSITVGVCLCPSRCDVKGFSPCDCQRSHSGSPVLLKDWLNAEKFCCYVMITVNMSCGGVGVDFGATPIPELQRQNQWE